MRLCLKAWCLLGTTTSTIMLRILILLKLPMMILATPSRPLCARAEQYVIWCSSAFCVMLALSTMCCSWGCLNSQLRSVYSRIYRSATTNSCFLQLPDRTCPLKFSLAQNNWQRTSVVVGGYTRPSQVIVMDLINTPEFYWFLIPEMAAPLHTRFLCSYSTLLCVINTDTPFMTAYFHGFTQSGGHLIWYKQL